MCDARKALLIGIDRYDAIEFPDLQGCSLDAVGMKDLLCQNGDDDETRNFECELITTDTCKYVTRALLFERIRELFHDFDGHVLFYFSGHGAVTDVGGYFVAEDSVRNDYGMKMTELIELAAKSPCASATIIVDACHSGAMGNHSLLQGLNRDVSLLPEGVTVLAASSPTQYAIQESGRGLFTSLLQGALEGAAADIMGNITAASMFSYVDQALGAWSQSPMFKTNDRRLTPLRRIKPKISLSQLRRLQAIFKDPILPFQLDPSYEHDDKCKLDPSYKLTEDGVLPEKYLSVPENVDVFDLLKKYRDTQLIQINVEKDLFYAAMRSQSVSLTPLGRFYWKLAKDNRI